MNNKPATFIIFSPAFPGNESDDIWLPWLQSLVKAINKNYPSLKIIIFSFQYPHVSETYTWHGNTIIPFNGMHKKKLGRLLMWLAIFKKIRKIKQQNNITGIFSMWCNECAFIGKYFSKLLGIQHYCWILGQDARAGNKYIKWIRPKPVELVAMSDFLVKQFYNMHGIKPAHVIINGIEQSLFTAMLPVKDIDVIGVGGLNVLKRYDMFVEIIAELKNYFPSIKAMLCGEGEEAEHIKQMITNLSLKENIEMTGMLQHVQVIHKMERAKILLHTSSYEGFSSVCLEALYAGARVISFIQPMNFEIKNWHIVQTKEEMFQMALLLLQDEPVVYERVLVQSMDSTTNEIAGLFGIANNI